MSALFKELHDKIGEKRAFRHYLAYCVEQSGLPESEIAEKLTFAYNHGVSYKLFSRRRMWTRSLDDLERAGEVYSERTSERELRDEDIIRRVSELTGKSTDAVRKDIEKSAREYGTTTMDYMDFRIWELTPAEASSYLTKRVFDDLEFKYNTDSEDAKSLTYKARFAKKFDKYMGRIWFTNGTGLDYERFIKKTKNLDSLFIKPSSATHGEGAHIIHFDDYDSMDDVYTYIKSLPYSMCEEILVQHPEMMQLNPSSVNTIRLITIFDGNDVHHVSAGMRMGNGGVVDNFHADGLICSLDVETGTVETDGVNGSGEFFETHPMTGVRIKGFRVPHWDQVLKITGEAAMLVPGTGMVGWDVAVTADGACLIEGNTEPGRASVQLPYIREHLGRKYIFEPYL